MNTQRTGDGFFEKMMVKNLGIFGDKRLKDYALPEYESLIPMLVLTPSVVNDGRRMLISPQPISFLCYHNNATLKNQSANENIEYNALFSENSPMNLRITSALRMNATFPYILPMVLCAYRAIY